MRRWVVPSIVCLCGSDADQSLLAFCQSVLAGVSRPQFSWAVDPNEGSVTDVAPPCGDGWVDFLDYAALTSEMKH